METSGLYEIITAHGHRNVLAIHKTTLEITKESVLSKNGDCVIAVEADKAVRDLNQNLKVMLKNDNTKLTIALEAGGVTEVIKAHGSSRLSLSHPTDVVIRKSSYVCDRTLAIRADKAATDLSGQFVKKMQDPEQEVKIKLALQV